jgi:hypothetical protein
MTITMDHIGEFASMIDDVVSRDTWSMHAFVATVTSQNSDGTYNVHPKDTTLPDMSSLKWLGNGTWKKVSKGDKVVCAFDADDNAWILSPVSSTNTNSDWVPLGNALVSFLNTLASAHNNHSHTYAPGPSAPIQTDTPATNVTNNQNVNVPSNLLSATVKVEK